MSLTILSVAFSLAPVGPDAAGGAEQVLSQLDHALVAAGHRSLVVALDGSRVAGELLAVRAPAGPLGDSAKRAAQARFRERVAEALLRAPVDLVHMHGIDFAATIPPPGPPVLVTLHLPPGWYAGEALLTERPLTWFNPVSEAQRRACPAGMRLLPPVANGVAVERLVARHARRRFALALGRICPEKGFDIALDAARRARAPVVLAGELFRYAEHERFFREEIEPRLGPGARWAGPVGFGRKRRLLSAARCLLVPSRVPETSSLVAMEALACGTPVIAFPAGALPEIVEDGRTGFLVEDTAAMAAAILRADEIDPETCREAARRRFSAARTAAEYLDLYARLARRAAERDGRAA